MVDIGFGDREYWAFTNEYGQLVKVIAKEIILQDDATEPVKFNGRYYNDEAKIQGTERSDLDEGHVIADSLGGVSNAYNIAPKNSTLNRYCDQAYMEKVIRQDDKNIFDILMRTTGYGRLEYLYSSNNIEFKYEDYSKIYIKKIESIVKNLQKLSFEDSRKVFIFLSEDISNNRF